VAHLSEEGAIHSGAKLMDDNILYRLSKEFGQDCSTLRRFRRVYPTAR
jgi:hypothetical protein